MKGFPSVVMLAVVAVLVLFSTGSERVYAQIMQNPEAVPLRRLWTLKGELSGEYIGQSIGSIGDVNGDGLADFAVMSKGVWSVYYGGNPRPGSEPVWRSRDSVHSSVMVHGDFWGTGHGAVGFRPDSLGETGYTPRLYLFRTEDGYLPDTPSVILRPGGLGSARQMFAEDMDGSPGEELVLVFPAASGTRANIWIYRGGEGFPSDSPGVVLQDDEINDHRYYQAVVGDADGDGYVDLVTACMYPSGAKLKFYFGREGSPWNWVEPDRVVEMEGELYPDFGYRGGFATVDSDGDGAMDLLISNYLYRTGGEKSARSRLYTRWEADVEFAPPPGGVESRRWGSLGYISDSTEQYDDVPLYIRTPEYPNGRLVLLGGGRYGPNRTYDAYYDPMLDGLRPEVYGEMLPLGDCNGDGWNDFLIATDKYGGWGDEGIALVIGGGPDIPSDDPTVSVQEVPVAGIAGGLSVWPNPVEGDRLNLGWRGDLGRKPERFTVHDVRGELVADGRVEPCKGSAWWSCGEAPTGVYLVRAYDGAGQVLATTTVVVRR